MSKQVPEVADSSSEVAEAASITAVSIRPGVSVLAVLAHLEYKPWHALAEYVDNSLQSFLDNREALVAMGQEKVCVEIEVDASAGSLTIRDNAAGIPLSAFGRAFRPAQVPPNCGGLSEFGMGMKSASCWFAPRWLVRTSALGEPVERRVAFDIEVIVRDELDELHVAEVEAPTDAAFTVVELHACRAIPSGRTSAKIKEHISDIFRDFHRGGELELVYRGESLNYENPKVLNAPEFGSDLTPVSDEAVEWKKSIEFDLGDGIRVSGFAGLLAKGSTKYAGFSLFRRRRVIQGSADEKYRPEAIFGSSTTYVYQRLFGELHLEGFEVSHTKDGFRWDENEEPFLELLREHLEGDLSTDDSMNLLRQARQYREKVSSERVCRVAKRVAETTGAAIHDHLPESAAAIKSQESSPPPRQPAIDLPAADLATTREIDVEFFDQHWRVVLELSNDPSINDWISISESVLKDVDDRDRHTLGVRMSLCHPFMERLVPMDASHVEPLVRIAAGLALAEKFARCAGGDYPSMVRGNLNELLRGALALGGGQNGSKPGAAS